MKVLKALTMVCGCLLAAGAIASPDYPSKPIQVVVPYGPGGVVDVVSRIVVDKMAAAYILQGVLDRLRPLPSDE